jgi:L-rhamnose isomerase
MTLGTDLLFPALHHFRIELPSWGFAGAGMLFGKFIQPPPASGASAYSSEQRHA